ncbi:DUF4350 domain-containing protein [Micromonospora sp. DR5-3]|uniref:DUF4350 domain-containing protein n=1 Tax=unclassified Micromonospora TaxID=2617518 RepID=UPI0011D467C5|nr:MULTISPECIES: DUF4350 domain-containing protein [unclassified Micromonospora]MCW3814703.1 DUF4350 domain-containing protein [Micromonospora sp. DR5-3]TYC23492.1 DUF4350 domain-containing protein [Micromonospora sp. MP36]
MTATLDPTRPVAPPPPRRRWHRALIPLGLAVLLIAATLVFHAVDQPDPTDRGFLSPVATGDDGGSRLAAALREQGVTVRRETDPGRALVAASSSPTTLFVPAPELLHPATVAALTDLPVGSRLVLVDPPRRVLEQLDLPLLPTGARWATRATTPDADGHPCPLAEATRAGTAAAERQRYAARDATPVDRCYSGGLVRVPWPVEVVVIGASDPFRDERIDEWGNLALATGLLGGTRPLVWLDLPAPAPAPTGPGWSPSPTAGHGNGNDAPPRDRGSSDDRPARPNPLWDAFPTWFWALLVQLALAGLLVVLWRARRLGPPVPEPLPVTVHSAETVLGRARLYRRAGALGPTAETLRAAALDRLLPRLNLPPDTPPAEVAARVAAYVGADPERVAELLHGADPTTDQELLELARDLDTLTRTVVAHPTEGDPR